MRIGILTYHFGTNFGGQLQCYALMKTLEALGHNVTIINYIPGTFRHTVFNDIKYALWNIKKDFCYDTIVSGIFSVLFSKKMRRNFDCFRKEWLNVGPLCNLDDFNELYDLDAIIVGSDQVWGPGHHNSGAYFLNFKGEFSGKRISYAPCCAINKVEEKNKNKISKLLERFDSLSARNIETLNFVKDLIGKDISIVADPTILHTFKEFTSPKTPQKDYILTYILGDEIDDGHKTAVKRIKEEYGELPVYSINLTASNPHYYSWCKKTYNTLSPVDWVDFIRNAKFLYTDSFHGVIFALKFNTPFLAYYKEAIRASRFIDLKERYLLNNIINRLSDIKDVSIKGLQPRTNTMEIIEESREFSIQYLKEALT